MIPTPTRPPCFRANKQMTTYQINLCGWVCRFLQKVTVFSLQGKLSLLPLQMVQKSLSHPSATWCQEPTHWKQTLMLGKTEGKRRRGRQRTRRLDSITDSAGKSLSKLRETLEGRGAWCAAVHGVSRRTQPRAWTTTWWWRNKILQGQLLQKMLAAVGTMTDEILYIVFPQFLVIKQALSKLLHCILQPKGKNDFSKLGVLLQ